MSLALSQDGRTLLSGSADNTVKVWRAVPGDSLHRPGKRVCRLLLSSLLEQQDAQRVMGRGMVPIEFQGFGGMHGGFVPAGLTGAGKTYRRGDEGPILMVAAMDREAKATDMRIRLDWEMIRHLPDMRRHGPPEGAEKMPPLSPPAGAALHGGGGGGGSGSWHSEASVETELSIAGVESHFAKQLERAGWTRLGGTAQDVVAWSSWRVPGEGDWRGLLLVLGAFKQGEPYLYLRIEAADPDRGGWYSGGSVRAYRG